MSDNVFPAPTLAAPADNDVLDVTVEAPAPSADASRSTAEYARTIGATVPAGLQPKPVETTDPNERILVMPYAGYDFRVQAHKFTGEVIEWLEVGRVAAAVRTLIGDNQWNMIKGWHAKDLKKFVEALQGLDLVGK